MTQRPHRRQKRPPRPRHPQNENRVQKNRPQRTWHHLRPQSRGGEHKSKYRSNELYMDATRHEQFHELFSNLRVSEIVALMLFHWTTFCPLEEKKEAHTRLSQRGFIKRCKIWNFFFGENHSRYEILEAMVREFVLTIEDKAEVLRILQKAVATTDLQPHEAETLRKIIEA